MKDPFAKYVFIAIALFMGFLGFIVFDEVWAERQYEKRSCEIVGKEFDPGTSGSTGFSSSGNPVYISGSPKKYTIVEHCGDGIFRRRNVRSDEFYRLNEGDILSEREILVRCIGKWTGRDCT